ncbi:transcriptional antiterminator [Lactobacillus colini]|uniref:Transcriptional antiterminator n=1 Tax=Lactobacillus colini TaxID=1819254 RepID=A0ABS4MGY8_9LACO|nr:PTS sugar transporter subunit IIA [Lactobacillus colini]MBP2058961.1 transcriptional antiterminator [Lactobacillus colini]
MKNKRKQLVYFLSQKNHEVTSTELAQELKVTTRTIRNYIKKINQNNTDIQILGNHAGYYLKQRKNQLKKDETIPQTEKDRYLILIKQLLSNKVINSFDLCEQWHVSYSTIQRTISYGNKTLAEWELKIRIQHSNIVLEGDEYNKRKYFTHLLYIENSHSFFNDAYLSKTFDSNTLHKVEDIIDGAIKNYNVAINEFSYDTLLIHILVMVSRYQNYKEESNRTNTKEDEFSSLTSETIKQLEEEFSIRFVTADKDQINILLHSSIEKNMSTNIHIPTMFLDKIKSVIMKTEKNYAISLHSPNFVIPFAVHVQRLIKRSNSGQSINNPFTNSYRNKTPLIFDIATYMASLIQKNWHIKVSQNEITFLAMHISTELRRNFDNSIKLNAIVIAPTYLNIQNHVVDFLNKNFFSKLTILHIIEEKDTSAYNLENYDVVFNTQDTMSYSEHEITINIADIEWNKNTIKEKIDSLLLRKKITRMAKLIDSVFPDNLFFKIENNMNKENLLKKICKYMVSKKYADKDFYKKIIEREKLSSTAFNNIAIPHPINYSSIDTKIAFIIIPNLMQWDHNQVNIVLLISIAKNRRDEFKRLYEILIELLEDYNKKKQIMNCKNMEEIKKVLFDF